MAEVDFESARTALIRLKEAGHHIGPYLMSGAQRATWWLLPLRTGYRVAGVAGVTVRFAGWELLAPAPGRYVNDRTWILPDTSSAQRRVLTAADDLRNALERRSTPCR
ncbi:hypothetical protein ACFP1Z_00635 [Streptomyces gamaensis]|uniref:Uncharacterized protein n=1 Tax=Streptomyces gamaensis TaxID=1763542 RepID=A0ABW0YQ52_9ACTN